MNRGQAIRRSAVAIFIAFLLVLPLMPAGTGFAADDEDSAVTSSGKVRENSDPGSAAPGGMQGQGEDPHAVSPAFAPESLATDETGEAGGRADSDGSDDAAGAADGVFRVEDKAARDLLGSALGFIRSALPRQQDRADELGEPVHRKILGERSDGTYDLTLTVQGDSRFSQDIARANVVVVLDASSSMRNQVGGGSTRMSVAKQCIRSLASTLLSQNDGQDDPLVEMSLITLATKVGVTSDWYADAGSFNSVVNGASYYSGNFGGTNWEDALAAAKGAADAKHAENSNPTYVIFLSDGLPTFRNTQGSGWNDRNMAAHTEYGVWGTGYDGNTTTVSRCYDMSKDDARAIVLAGHEFYGISVFEQVDRVASLVDYAYTGNDYDTDPTGTTHHYHAGSQAELNQALSAIVHNIVTHVYYSNVAIHDTLDLQNVGFASEGPVAYVLRKEFPDGTVITYDSATGVTTGGAWDFGVPEFGAGGMVSWNPESGQDALLDDATYSITFQIAPSQQACDTSADSPSSFVPGDNDGDGVDDAMGLRSNVPSEAYVSYHVATVTEDGGTMTVEQEGPYTTEYNKPVVTPAPSHLTIVKHWEGDGSGQAASVRPSVLHGTVTRDDGKEYPVELVPAGADAYAIGVDVPAGPEGHLYAFAEELLPPYYAASAVTAQASAPSTAHADGSIHLMGTGAQEAVFEVTNTYIAFPLTVWKVESTSGISLEGAQFTLYQDDGDGVFDSAADPLAAVFADPFLTQLAEGSSLTTGATGAVTFHGLLVGRSYWLLETRAPTGYNLDTAAHAIVVSPGGVMHTFDSAGAPAELPLADGTPTIVIADEPIPDLPVTAGPGIRLLMAAGACLLLAGLALAGAAAVRRRKAG